VPSTTKITIAIVVTLSLSISLLFFLFCKDPNYQNLCREVP